MTSKHRDPEFQRNSRLVRAQVRRAWKIGTDVSCWRCGRVLEPGSAFDVGHLDPDGGPGRSNLAPECVRCNRREGGRRGAAITNGRHRPAAVVPRGRAGGPGLVPW